MNRCLWFAVVTVVTVLSVTLILPGGVPPARADEVAMSSEGGRLDALDADGNVRGPCPLQHTDVDVQVSGFLTRVTVRQRYENPYPDKIEAVYTFPLSHRAAVDRMTMEIGDRVVVGEVHERTRARQIYEAARAQGHVAGLLEQERPNIFTQSVANIEPGAIIVIEISYVETLESKEGQYTFDFPMTVGPRYIPGSSTVGDPNPQGTSQRPDAGASFSPNTNQVPDASRVTPMPVRPEQRAGHDISLRISIDTGGPAIEHVESVLHEIVRVDADERTDGRMHRVTYELVDQQEIPNRDFVMHWRQAAESIEEAVFMHAGQKGNFFTLILAPPKRVAVEQAVPRELVFVLDTSGSMRGFPIEKAKAVMSKAIDTLRPRDTFNLITFAGRTRMLWPTPRPVNETTRRQAQAFLRDQRGGGGTEMMQAINAALQQDDVGSEVRPLRIVCFMTDGYVGNDHAIIDAIRRNAHTTRVFSFGIGNSVNRYLLDNMAKAGRGAVEYVLIGDGAGEEAADERVASFYRRIQTPVLTDIDLTFTGDVQVTDCLPSPVPDLFDAKPIIVHGRYVQGGAGTVVIRGLTGQGTYERRLALTFPEQQSEHDTIATLWARAKVTALLETDLAALQQQTFPADLKHEVIALGERFQIMTPFTSFVAVEKARVTIDGEPRLVTVPIEMPDKVSWEGIFGGSCDDADSLANSLRDDFPIEVRSQAAVPVPESAQANRHRDRHARGRSNAPAASAASPVRRWYFADAATAPACFGQALAKGASAPGPSRGVHRAGVLTEGDAPALAGDLVEVQVLSRSGHVNGDEKEEAVAADAVSGPSEGSADRDAVIRLVTRGLQRLAKGQEVPGEARPGLVERCVLLAVSLHQEGHEDEAVTLAGALIRAYPDHRLACALQTALTDEGLAPDARYARLEQLVRAARRSLERRAKLYYRLSKDLQKIAENLQTARQSGRIQDQQRGLLVTVLVTESSGQTSETLRQAGLRVEAKADGANMVVGWIAPADLDKLALLDEVRRIEPADCQTVFH